MDIYYIRIRRIASVSIVIVQTIDCSRNINIQRVGRPLFHRLAIPDRPKTNSRPNNKLLANSPFLLYNNINPNNIIKYNKHPATNKHRH